LYKLTPIALYLIGYFQKNLNIF